MGKLVVFLPDGTTKAIGLGRHCLWAVTMDGGQRGPISSPSPAPPTVPTV